MRMVGGEKMRGTVKLENKSGHYWTGRKHKLQTGYTFGTVLKGAKISQGGLE